MRKSSTPSIVPNDGHDQTVYLVLDCLGRNGCVWRETDAEHADLETVISDLMTGHYSDPNRVAAFNTAEHWSRDVSEDVALKSNAAPIWPTKISHQHSTTLWTAFAAMIISSR